MQRLSAGEPTLFYMWTPHPIGKAHKIHRIQLPAQLREGKTDYNTDFLEKLASAKLEMVAPRVQDLYSRFTLTNDDQERMMLSMYSEGLSAMEAACAWMKDNRAWRRWIPPSSVLLGALLPLTGPWAEGPSIAGALPLAVERVNANPSLLPGLTLEYVVRDSACSGQAALRGFGELIATEGRIDAMLGPGCRSARRVCGWCISPKPVTWDCMMPWICCSVGCEPTGFLAAGQNLAQAHTHTHAHARKGTRTHACMRTRTHTYHTLTDRRTYRLVERQTGRRTDGQLD